MTCAIYARVSTQDQNCAIQLDELRGWAARHEWVVYGEYIDHALSGDDATRPELARIMADAQARRFDAIIVTKLDRFGRSISDFLTNIDDLDLHGVRFIATSQNLDTDKNSAAGRFMIHILAAVAQFEKALIVERTTAGVRHAKKNGTRSGKLIGGQRRIFDRARANELRAAGMSWRAVSSELRVPVATLHRALGKVPPRENPQEQYFSTEKLLDKSDLPIHTKSTCFGPTFPLS